MKKKNPKRRGLSWKQFWDKVSKANNKNVDDWERDQRRARREASEQGPLYAN
jgi:hypothetical protein